MRLCENCHEAITTYEEHANVEVTIYTEEMGYGKPHKFAICKNCLGKARWYIRWLPKV